MSRLLMMFGRAMINNQKIAHIRLLATIQSSQHTRRNSYKKAPLLVTAYENTVLRRKMSNVSSVNEMGLSEGEAAGEEALHFSNANEDIFDDASTSIDLKSQIDNALRDLEIKCTRLNNTFQQFGRSEEIEIIRAMKPVRKVLDLLNKSEPHVKAQVLPNLAVYCSNLLGCCGKSMIDTPVKHREALAGLIWTVIKENKLPLDITHYNNLIKVMNDNGTIFDPKKMIEEIKEGNLKLFRVTYQRLIHQYCLQGDIRNATNLLETMKDAGMELSETVFASLIIGYSKQDSAPPITEIFELMKSNNIEPDSKSYTAALLSIADCMARDSERATKEMDVIKQLISEAEIEFTLQESIDIIVNLGPFKRTNKVVEEIINPIINRKRFFQTSHVILSALCNAKLLDEASELFWSNSRTIMSQSDNLGYAIPYIRVLVSNPNVPPERAIAECLKLPHEPRVVLDSLFRAAAIVGRYELLQNVLRLRAKTEQLGIHYYWPLLVHARTKEEIFQVLKEHIGQNFNLVDQFETFSMWVWPKFIDEPSELIKFNNQLQFSKYMLTASLLQCSIREKKIDEAIKFMQHSLPKIIEEPKIGQTAGAVQNVVCDEGKNRQNFGASGREMQRLYMNIMALTKNPDFVKLAIKSTSPPGQKPTVESLEVLVKSHLANDNLSAAIEEFETCMKLHRVPVCRYLLMERCLVNKDQKNLKKVMDVSALEYGEKNSLYDLGMALLKLNKLKQARKIFSNPEIKIDPDKVYKSCDWLARTNQITQLENMVIVARDMHDINKDTLYEILLAAYRKIDKPERALNLWNMLQEHEQQPSKRTLNMIASTLDCAKIEVPFQRPRVSKFNDKAY